MFYKDKFRDDRKKVIDYTDYLDSDWWWKNKTKKHMKEGIEYRIISKNGKIKWVGAKTYSTTKFKKQGVRFGMMWEIAKELNGVTPTIRHF
jgi:hypothetical protein